MSDQFMAPDASPGGLKESAQKPKGVKVLNRKPLGIALAFAGGILFIMMMVAMERAEQSSGKMGAQAAAKSTNAANLADSVLSRAPQSRFIQPASSPALPPEVEIKPPEPVNPLPPLPPSGQASQTAPQVRTPLDEMMLRVEMAKLQLFDQAVKAQTTVQLQGNARIAANSQPNAMGGSAIASNRELASNLAEVRQRLSELTTNDPSAAYQEKLNAARANAAPYNAPTASGPGNNEISLAQASGADIPPVPERAAGDNRWALNTTMRPPGSAYEVRAGFVIPAVMTSGINSDLAGTIIARTAQNVYDTATGKHLMIPLGSTLVGSYSSNIVYGQERVLIAWQRIVFPDGQALDLGAMPGTDGAGYAGFADEVDNHYLRIFGSAFLMSGIVAAVSMSQNNNNDDSGSNNQRASDALSEALGQQLGNTMSQMISKSLNIAPTITVRPGYRFNIIVIKDLTFNRPYKSFNHSQ